MEVSLHTKLKHKILTYYFSAGWKNAFKSGKIYSLAYVDLFSGDGICCCSELDEELEKYLPEDLNKRTWRPSFFNLMGYAKDAGFNLKCYFNDINAEKIKLLSEEIKKENYSDYVEEYYTQDANIVYKNILDKIGQPNKPTLFYIDPTNHNHLNFSTIEGIANFKDNSKDRRPELIINFMLNSIFMAMKRGLPSEEVASINRFLGTDFTRDDLIRIIQDESEKSYVTFLNIYLDKLNKFGYNCNYHLIKSTISHAPIYYLIFATVRKDVSSWYKNINSYVQNIEDEWVKKNYTIKTMTEFKKKGQKFLTEY